MGCFVNFKNTEEQYDRICFFVDVVTETPRIDCLCNVIINKKNPTNTTNPTNK